MRVIAGNARGRRIKAPKGSAVRPTADRVKESLFNILANELAGARVLDLFAGTGNLAIEALSRGAAQAVLVDFSAVSVQLIRENLQRLGLSERAKIVSAPVRRALNTLGVHRDKFDIVFLDPPYGQELVPLTLNLMARNQLLNAAATVVAEHSTRDDVRERYEQLERVDQRRYGDTLLSFYRLQTKPLEQGIVDHGR